jgi:hypothetical protein
MDINTYFKDKLSKNYLYTGLGIIGTSTILLSTKFKVAKPNQYIITTGAFINNINVSKSSLVLPIIQKYKIVDINPKLYKYDFTYKYDNNLQFNLHINCIVGPIAPDKNITGFIKYSELLDNTSNLDNIITNIINNNISTLINNVDINDIFTNKNKIKQDIWNYIKNDFFPIGLDLYSSNIDNPNNIIYNEQYNESLFNNNRNNISDIIKLRDNIEINDNEEYNIRIKKKYDDIDIKNNIYNQLPIL